MNLLFFNISGGEIFFVVLVAFVLFGPKRIPEISRKVGKVLSQLRKASDDFKNEIMQEDEQEDDWKWKEKWEKAENEKPDDVGEPEKPEN